MNDGKRFILLISGLTAISLALAFALQVPIVNAESSELHVGPDQEYRSIAAAIEDANPGDTVLVHNGTYSNSIEDFNMKIKKDNLTIRSKNGPTNTVVGPDNYATECGPIFQIMGDNIVLKGFKVENTAGFGIWVRENSQGSKVANNIVVNNDIGIASRENTNNILIENNVVCYNRKGIAFGGGSNQKCLRNRVYNNWEKGIQLQDVENCLAKSNVVAEAGLMGVLVGDDGYGADPPYTPIGQEDVTIRDSFVSPLWIFGVKKLKLINSRVEDIRGCMEVGPEGNGLIVFENTVVNGLIRLTVSGERYKIRGNVEINGSKNLDEISFGAGRREPKSLVEKKGKIIRSYPTIVEDQSGNPVSDVTVSLLDKENRKVWSGETDENGRITFDITFDENNFRENWTLRTIPSDGMVLKKKVNLLSDTPVNLSPIPEFSVVNIGVQPQEIKVGETVEIYVGVRNTGDLEVEDLEIPLKGFPDFTEDQMSTWVHPRFVSLSENEEITTIKIENASLSPGEKRAISISASFENTGAHKLTAGDLSKTMQIGKPPQQISIPSVNILENENVSIDISLRSAPMGLFDFAIALNLKNPSIANIMDVNPPNWAVSENLHSYRIMNGTAYFRGTDLKRKIKPGMENIALGSLLLKGVKHGNTKLTADIYQMSDDRGYSIMPEVKPGSVKVKPPTTEFSVSDLSLSRSKVEPGETTTVSVIVKNVGETEGSKTVEVKIDGRIENKKTILLSPGESKTIEFTISKEEEGTYKVRVGEMSKSFTVEKVVANLKLRSGAFKKGENIPVKYTADGKNISPPLNIDNVPDQAKSLALVVVDLDAPGGKFTHWIMWNIPPDIGAIPKDFPNEKVVEELGGAKQGKNDFGEIGYGGPSPPKGSSHRYRFTLYALDKELELSAGATKGQLMDRMEGHILQKSKLTGIYKRPKGGGKGLPWALIGGIIVAVIAISAFGLYRRK